MSVLNPSQCAEKPEHHAKIQGGDTSDSDSKTYFFGHTLRIPCLSLFHQPEREISVVKVNHAIHKPRLFIAPCLIPTIDPIPGVVIQKDTSGVNPIFLLGDTHQDLSDPATKNVLITAASARRYGHATKMGVS